MLNNTIKNYWALLCLLLVSTLSSAQQVYVEAGLGSAFFKDYNNIFGKNTLIESRSKAVESFLEEGLKVHTHLSSDWLTQGTNGYNNVVFDIYKEKTIDRSLVRYPYELGVEYVITEKLSTYTSFNIANNLQKNNERYPRWRKV